jgi:hypothetical protein
MASDQSLLLIRLRRFPSGRALPGATRRRRGRCGWVWCSPPAGPSDCLPPGIQTWTGLTPGRGGATLSAMIDARLVRNRALDYGRVVTCGCPRAQR